MQRSSSLSNPYDAAAIATTRLTVRRITRRNDTNPTYTRPAGKRGWSLWIQAFGDEGGASVGVVVPGEEAARGRDETSGRDLVDARLAGGRREELVVFGPYEQQRHGEAGEPGVAENELGAGRATHEEAPQQRSIRRGLARHAQREEVQ